MKHYLRSMLTLLVLFVVGGVNSWADEVTFDLSSQGFSNAAAVTTVTSGSVTLTFASGSGSNSPKYYTSGSAVRMYSGNTLTVSVSSGTISSVEFTFTSTGYSKLSATTPTDGTYTTSGTTGTWSEGSTSTSSLVMTSSTTSGDQSRVKSVKVTYTGGSTTTKPDAPTFSPEAGTYSSAQSVTISGPTGASIYYTTNGDDPTTSSTQYSSAISVSTTTTLKAIAVVDGVSSDVAEATYTINSGSTTTGEKTYTKVTSTDQLVSGNKYLIVYEGNSSGANAAALTTKTSSNNRGGKADVTITNSTITTDVNSDGYPYEYTLGGSTDAWTFYNATTSQYLNPATNSGNLMFGSSASSSWKIDPSSSASYTIRSNASSSLPLNYNASSKFFACYNTSSNQQNVALYVESTAASTVPAPTITYDETTHTVTITAEDGLTIYYTTGGVDVVSDGKLSGSEVYYTGEFTISKATTIKAVAVDADGNISSVTTQVCTYNGEVTLPYYEEFHDDLGNFTTTNTSTSTSYSAPEWELLDRTSASDISYYGEARKFAFVAGYINSSSEIRIGEAKMTSPIIDLTTADGEQAYTSVTLDFSHAGSRFSSVADSKLKCRLYVCEEGSTDSTRLDIPNWFTIDSKYPRQNSGDIDLSNYIGKKIRITFKFSNYSTSSSSAGVWNIIKFNVVGVKPGQDRQHESVSLSDNGFFTYVTQNPIDWKSTLDANSTTDGNNINIHGYKVTQFNKTKAVLVEFGKNTANTNSEDITPAGTPIVLQGTVGENKLIVSNNSNDQIPSVKGNLLHAAAEGGTKPSATQSLYALKKKKNQDATDDMGHYIWRKLKTTQTVPYGKAYLNGAQMTDGEITTTTNAAKGIFTSFEDIQESQGTTTGIVEVPTAEHKTTDGYFYNLQGMRVAHPAHGIYIYNGRKIIIK